MRIRHRMLFVASLSVLAATAATAQTPPAAPPKKPAAAAKAPAAKGKGTSFDPALLQPALLKAKAPAEYDVKFVTTAGEFTVHVTRAWAPNGADRFYNLVRHRFFDGAAFFRVIPGFMAQFGLSAYPNVSAAWQNANIKDDPVVQSNHRGFVTFAQTSMPNSRSTQLFINFGNNERLDHDRFAPFGMVTDGMDAVDKLYGGYGESPDQGQIGNQGRAYLDHNFPKLDKIQSATLVATAPAAAK